MDIILDKKNDEIYSNVIFKWLQFFYGFDIKFELNELSAALSAYFQLQIKDNHRSFQEKFEKFMINIAENDVESGIILMKSCLFYKECHNDFTSRIDNEIAKRLLTLSNMENHTKIMNSFILSLPAEYLDKFKEFGKPHTQFCEFQIRRMYLDYHKNLSTQNKCKILNKCDLTKLNSKEMIQLKALNILTPSQLNDVYQSLVISMENKLELSPKQKKNVYPTFDSLLLPNSNEQIDLKAEIEMLRFKTNRLEEEKVNLQAEKQFLQKKINDLEKKLQQLPSNE